MRNLKKFLALVLAVMMVMSLMVTVNAKTADEFSDSDKLDPAYEEAMDVMLAIGMTSGASEDKLDPEGHYKRYMLAIQLYVFANGDLGDDDTVLQMWDNPKLDVFSDLRYYAEYAKYAKYINYAADQGWINGIGGGKFNPNGTVTLPHVLLAMLNVLGQSETVTGGARWEMQTMQAAQKAGLGDKELLSTKSAERQQAFQIIFNAMRQTYTGTAADPLYRVIGADGTLLYNGKNSETANKIANENSGSFLRTITPPNSTTGNVLKSVFNVEKATVTDAAGRVTTGWKVGDNIVGGTTQTSADAEIFNTKKAVGEVDKALEDAGVTKVSDTVEVYRNGYRVTTYETALKHADGFKTPLGDGEEGAGKSVLSYLTSTNNSTVEVYVDGGKITKVISTNTFTKVLDADSLANFEKDGYVLLKDSWGSSWDGTFPVKAAGGSPNNSAGVKWYTDEELKVGDVVLYTRGQGADGKPVLLNAYKAEVVVGILEEYENGVYVINGEKYVLSDGAVGGLADADIEATLTHGEYTFYIGCNNGILKLEAGDIADDSDPQYLYVLNYWADLKPTSGDPYVKAKVIDLVDGKLKTITIATVENNDKLYLATKSGNPGAPVEANIPIATNETADNEYKGFYTYVETDMGYVLTDAKIDENVTADKTTTGIVVTGDVATTAGGRTVTTGIGTLYANSATTLTQIAMSYTTDAQTSNQTITTVSADTVIGYTNFGSINTSTTGSGSGSSSNSFVAYILFYNDEKVVTAIYLIEAAADADAGGATVKKAIYTGEGKTTLSGTELNFLVNGEKVTYTKGSMDATAGNLLVVGTVLDLTLDATGKKVTGATVSTVDATTGDIEYVDGTYMLIEGAEEALTLTETCLVYKVTTSATGPAVAAATTQDAAKATDVDVIELYYVGGNGVNAEKVALIVYRVTAT